MLWRLLSGSARWQNSEDHGRVRCDNGPEIHFQINLSYRVCDPDSWVYKGSTGVPFICKTDISLSEPTYPSSGALGSGFNCCVAEGVSTLIQKILSEHLLRARHGLMLWLLRWTRQIPFLMGLVSGREGRQSIRNQTPGVILESSKCQCEKEIRQGFVFGRRSRALSLAIHNIYVMVIYFIGDHFFNWGPAGNTISMLRGLSWSMTHVCFCFGWKVPLERSTQTPHTSNSTATFRLVIQQVAWLGSANTSIFLRAIDSNREM